MDTVKVIDTPYNNAVAVLNKTNELLNENNILDSTGTEIAQLEQNVANPAWLFALACGNLHTSWQEKLAKAYAALDPQNCEDDQVLVLAILAGVKRGNGTPSHITVLIKNTSENTITIPIGTEFTETYSNQTWVLNSNISLIANAQQYTTLYTITDGEFNVPSGITFNYDGTLPINCESSSSSTGGSTIESISELRNKLSQGGNTSNAILQAETEIEQLSGVETCSIWFNSDNAASMVIGSKTIPPRTAYISIRGYDVSGKLAETYYTYLDVPATVGAVQESYQRGLQALTVNFDIAQQVDIPIYVTLRASDMADGAAERVREIITSHSGTLKCGENITSQLISEWLKDFDYGTVLAANIGTSSGYISDIEPNQFVGFVNDTIYVTGV